MHIGRPLAAVATDSATARWMARRVGAGEKRITVVAQITHQAADSSSLFAGIPPARLYTLPHDQRQHRQRSYEIDPPPANHRHQHQTEQNASREPGADEWLVRVRRER